MSFVFSSNPYNIKTLLYSPINTINSVTNSLPPDINILNNVSWTSSLVRESNFHDNQSMVVTSDDPTTVSSTLENNDTLTKGTNNRIFLLIYEESER